MEFKINGIYAVQSGRKWCNSIGNFRTRKFRMDSFKVFHHIHLGFSGSSDCPKSKCVKKEFPVFPSFSFGTLCV